MLNLGLSPFSVTMMGGSDPVGHVPYRAEWIAIWEANYGITLNGGNVAAWTPKAVLSGETPASLALVQGTAGKQPLYTANRGDGIPSIDHDGTDDFLQNLVAGTQLLAAGHCLAMACTYPGSGSRVVCISDAAAANRAVDCLKNGVNLQDSPLKASAADGSLLVASPTVGAFRTQTHWRNGVNLTLRRGALSNTAVSANATKNATPRLTTGAFNDGSANSPVRISAIWLYRSAVDDAVVKAAMEARWPDYG